MHILYFHQHFSTPLGAVGIRSYAMARALVESGHSVTMVCGSYKQGNTGLDGPFRRGRREGMVHGIRVVEFDLSYSNRDGLPRRAWLFAKFAFGSVGLAVWRKYDIAFATTTPLSVGIPAMAARWLRGRPMVFEVRDLWPELPRAMGIIRNRAVLGLLSALEWASYRSANRCVGLSPGIVEGIAARGVPKERIALIPNGCDLDIFGSVTPWRPDGVRPDDMLAIFTGTHGPANGLDAVLDAAAVLQRRGRDDIKLALVGDGKMKPALMARAESEGLGNVVFHDPLPKARLADLMAGADLGLQILHDVPAFYRGTSPNKFFDYIAAGLPVLNNYPGWLAEMIGEAECGFAVGSRDPEAFADALERAAGDRAELARMGQRARALAVERFDRENLARQWVTWVTEG